MGDNQFSWKFIITTIIIAIVSVSWMQSWLRWQHMQNLMQFFHFAETPVSNPDDTQKINQNIEAMKQLNKAAAPLAGKEYDEMRKHTEQSFNADDKAN